MPMLKIFTGQQKKHVPTDEHRQGHAILSARMRNYIQIGLYHTVLHTDECGVFSAEKLQLVALH